MLEWGTMNARITSEEIRQENERYEEARQQIERERWVLGLTDAQYNRARDAVEHYTGR